MIKILQISDLHIRETADGEMLHTKTYDTFRQVLAHAHAEHGPFNLILVSGDLAQDPVAASYQLIAQALREYPAPYLCLPGNHDDYTVMQSQLNSPRGGCGKYFNLGDWRLIALNSQLPGSDSGYFNAEELQFLRHALNLAAGAPTLVAMHHHTLNSGSVWMDGMRLQNHAEFLAILEQAPQVKLTVCGHLHQALHWRFGSTDLYSCPATCFQFDLPSPRFGLTDQAPGYQIIELAENGGHQVSPGWLPKSSLSPMAASG